MSSSLLFMGGVDADPDDGPPIWTLGAGADDDGDPFEIFGRSNWIQPALGGGTCVFFDAFVTLTWTMGCTLRFKPVVDQDADSTTWENGTCEVVTSDIELTESVDGQRITQTFRIPLAVALLKGATEQTRNNLIGTRMQLTIASVDGLGAGDFIMDGCEIEYEQIVDQKQQEG